MEKRDKKTDLSVKTDQISEQQLQPENQFSLFSLGSAHLKNQNSNREDYLTPNMKTQSEVDRQSLFSLKGFDLKQIASSALFSIPQMNDDIIAVNDQLENQQKTPKESVASQVTVQNDKTKIQQDCLDELQLLDPQAWDYVTPSQVLKSDNKVQSGAYFNQDDPKDIAEINYAADKNSNILIQETESKFQSKKILQIYFENIFYPLDFSDDEDDQGNQGEKKIKVVKKYQTKSDEEWEKIDYFLIPLKQKINRIFHAVKDVSKEIENGILIESVKKGVIKEYNLEELEAAKKIFQEVIKFDLKNKAVTLDMLRIARDPDQIYKNITGNDDSIKFKTFKNADNEKTVDEELEVQEKPQKQLKEIQKTQKIELQESIDESTKKSLMDFNNGADMLNDRKTIKQIALFKALNQSHPGQIYYDILKGKIFGEQLNLFIMDNLKEEDLHQFKQRMANFKKKQRCVECRQHVKEKVKPKKKVRFGSPTMSECEKDIIDEVENKNEDQWNESDGMSDSILSGEDDKEDLQLIKQGQYVNKGMQVVQIQSQNLKQNAAQQNELSVNLVHSQLQKDQKTMYEKVAEIVDNINDIGEKVDQINLTKNDYINSLHEVSKQKLKSIQEAHQIFSKRVDKLIKTQQYELQQREQFAIKAGQEVFRNQSQIVKELFQKECDFLMNEYKLVFEQIRKYKRTIKSYNVKLFTQEQIISRLSNQISVNMKKRLDDKVETKECLYRNPFIDDEQFYLKTMKKIPESKIHKDKKGFGLKILQKELYRTRIYRKQFDLYGESIRLLQLPEKENVIKNVILKEKDIQIKELQDQNELLENQNTEIIEMYKVALEETIQLKQQVHELNLKIDSIKEKHQQEVDKINEINQYKVDRLKCQLKKVCDSYTTYRKYINVEEQVHESTKDYLENQVTKYKENVRNMRAILRIPRLCKLYHDRVRADKMKEFKILEDIYEEHFKIVSSEIEGNTQQYFTVAEKTLISKVQSEDLNQSETEQEKKDQIKSVKQNKVSSNADENNKYTFKSLNNRTQAQGFRLESRNNDFKSKFNQKVSQSQYDQFDELGQDSLISSQRNPQMKKLSQVTNMNQLKSIAEIPKYMQLHKKKYQQPGQKNDGSMNTSFTISFIKKNFNGVDLYLTKNFENNKKNSVPENDSTQITTGDKLSLNHLGQKKRQIFFQDNSIKERNPNKVFSLNDKLNITDSIQKESLFKQNSKYDSLNLYQETTLKKASMTARYSNFYNEQQSIDNVQNSSFAILNQTPQSVYHGFQTLKSTPFKNDLISRSIKDISPHDNNLSFIDNSITQADSSRHQDKIANELDSSKSKYVANSISTKNSLVMSSVFKPNQEHSLIIRNSKNFR